MKIKHLVTINPILYNDSESKIFDEPSVWYVCLKKANYFKVRIGWYLYLWKDERREDSPASVGEQLIFVSVVGTRSKSCRRSRSLRDWQTGLPPPSFSPYPG